MEIYVIADTHFYHNNIIKYCDRPFEDVEKMNEFIINKWNSVVSNEDIVLHLGDFGFGSKEQLTNICQQLNGYKILLKGNHDLRKGNGFFIDCGFQEVYKNKEMLLTEILGIPQDFIKTDSDVILSHYPRVVPNDKLNIHGHIHNAPLDINQFNQDNHICVSIEMINYEPVSLIKIVEEWRDKYERKTS